MPCNTVVVADGRETENSPILFPVPHSVHQGHCCPVKRVYDLSAHPPTPPVIPIITTSIECNSRN